MRGEGRDDARASRGPKGRRGPVAGAQIVSSDSTSRAWILDAHPKGAVGSALRFGAVPIPVPGDQQVLVRVLFLSVDPGQRTWMRAEGSYMPAFPLGMPMRGGILGEVIESRTSGIPEGSLVSGMGIWADYCVLGRRELRVIPADAPNPLLYMGALGATGWTAYFGIVDIGRPKAGDTLVVSAAAGAVGSIAGQIGRNLGCRVIGVAGSADKCRWLCEELGFDAAIDYRTQDVAAELDRHCPDGVDIYFENVGGAVGRAVYPRMAPHGRIVLCGLASGYQGSNAASSIDLADLLMKRVRIEAFVVTDYFGRLAEAIETLGGWLAEGKLKAGIDIVDGLENALDALNSLLAPGTTHRGKLLVGVAPSSSINRSTS